MAARDPFAPERYVTDAEPLLRAALALAGGVVEQPRARQVTYRPGRSITVAYEAMVGWGGRAPTKDRVVVRAARKPLRGSDPVAADDEGNPVHVFPASRDPALPGLGRALDTHLVAELFADLGIGSAADVVTVGLRSHRPLRRAVVEANGPRGRLFLKVVPPHEVETLHDRHRLLESSVPVPRSLGWTADGIIVLAPLPGRTLRDVLAGSGPIPTLGAVDALLDDLPDELAALPGAPPAQASMDDHVELLAAVMPPCGPRLAALREGIAELLATEELPPPTAVHGDLHEAQLMVDGSGRLVGVLDVDGAGAGGRIDDLANLIGHLSLLGRARRSSRCERLGASWMAELDARAEADPSTLRARVAAVVLGLSTGCFRVQEEQWPRRTWERIALAEAWLTSATRLGIGSARPGPGRTPEKDLTAASG